MFIKEGIKDCIINLEEQFKFERDEHRLLFVVEWLRTAASS